MTEDPKFWVAAAFVAFFVLFGRTILRALTKSLDNNRQQIAYELEEAVRLRRQAEETLAMYQNKYTHSLVEAEEIMHRAREQAAAMIDTARGELELALNARKSHALATIKREEEQAISGIRDHVVDITVAAAKSLIMEQIEKMPEDQLARSVIADIDRKVH